ncbi:MAG: tRNA (adenosine(37)-N6)-threonylcarbamoyltransferase complex transferase subunit TsaD [Lentisphaerae bacterium]|jgi:N6-L-threonylcarbamoyladenine synthase|nr:tRNA (adenosine(37)-N6)-threonylcarbamoyltransferase complex transferase subunit TsaD [Lentisphaerota bacterium]
MIVLGIETSCDETAAAIVRSGREILSSVVFSQIPLHQPYGGVVPEVASRSHVEKIGGVISDALTQANLPWSAIDAIAVTYGPGLASSLLVGLNAAKGLAVSLNRPLIGINHIEAHAYSPFLAPTAPPVEEAFPLLALVVSGGHSCLIEVNSLTDYHTIGQTLDDAAGEAFDKAAKLLDLGYPGGPAIDKAAAAATNPAAITFPQGRVQPDNPGLGTMDADLCASFSGLKTSLLYRLRENPPQSTADINAIAAAYQAAIVNALAERCQLALSRGHYRYLAVGGGVSLNRSLRQRLQQVAAHTNTPLLLAEPRLCGDNAAMIAGLAGAGGGITGLAALHLDATPSLPVGQPN